MAFVTVIARMPQQPRRKGNCAEWLVNAHQPELLLEDLRKRSGKRDQRVAVQREQEPDQHRGNPRGDVAGKLLSGKRAIDQVDGRKRVHLDVVCGGEATCSLAPRQGMTVAGKRDKLIVEQLEHADVGCRYWCALDVDDEMAAPVAQRIDIVLAMKWHPVDAHARSQWL